MIKYYKTLKGICCVRLDKKKVLYALDPRIKYFDNFLL